MPCQVSHQPTIRLREKNFLRFHEKKNVNTFKYFYSKSTSSRKNIFGMNSVKEFYSAVNIQFDSFKLQLTSKQEVLKILSNVDSEKACCLDETPKNYRQFSLLPVMSKVIERVLHNQLMKHQENYGIIFDYQSGFRGKHSVKTLLVHLSNQILKGLEARKSTGIRLIDLQRAFDALDHQIFLKKLNILGFHHKSLHGLNIF